LEKVFLSFLGTNRYLPCHYYLNNNEYAENVNFVQEAMVKIFYKKYEKLDKVIIFLTKKARQINWEPETKEPGLKGCLKDLNLPFKLIDVEIPEGKSSEEIWKIFEIVYNSLQDEDNVILDITHGFRSLPMLGIVLLNYARFLKRIKVLGIYYGAFEVLGTKDEIEKLPINERNAPIFDLTNFEKLQRWSIAAENFVDYGRTDKIYELVKEKIDPILKDTKGQDEIAQRERDIINNLKNVSNNLYTVRGKLTYEGNSFIELKNIIRNIDTNENISNPLKPLKEKILSKVLPFSTNDVLNGFRGVKWCIDHDLIQQGITLLQETIITYILEKSKLDWQVLNNRVAVSDAIKSINIDKIDDGFNVANEEIVQVLIQTIRKDETLFRLSKLFEKLRDYRNDINHGGYLKNARKPDKFKNKLLNIFNKVVETIPGIL